jgi:hypothetical protein
MTQCTTFQFLNVPLIVTRPGNVNFVADTLSMLSKPVLANISTSISPSPASTSEIETFVTSKKNENINMLVTVKYSKIKKKKNEMYKNYFDDNYNLLY